MGYPTLLLFSNCFNPNHPIRRIHPISFEISGYRDNPLQHQRRISPQQTYCQSGNHLSMFEKSANVTLQLEASHSSGKSGITPHKYLTQLSLRSTLCTTQTSAFDHSASSIHLNSTEVICQQLQTSHQSRGLGAVKTCHE